MREGRSRLSYACYGRRGRALCRGDHVSPPGRTHAPRARPTARQDPSSGPRREPRRSRGSLKCPLQDVAGVRTRSLGKTPPCSGLREGRPPRTAGPAPRLAVRDLGLRPARCHASEVTSVETERLLLPPPEAPRSTGPGLPAGQLHTCREKGARRICSREQAERTSRDTAARAPREAHRPPRPPQS